MNNSGVAFGSFYMVGSFPFPLPCFGSLTYEESEYIADKIRANSLTILDSIEKMAKTISEKEKISIEESLNFITKLVDGGIEETNDDNEKKRLMSFAINYREGILDIQNQNNPQKNQINQIKNLALMILRSRLDTQWLLENLQKLNKLYRLSLDSKSVSELLGEPEELWLTSEKRNTIFSKILQKLPLSEIRELAGFALAEEREWESIDDTVPQEKKVYSNGYEVIAMESENNENSTKTVTIESQPVELQTPSFTEQNTIAALATLSEKRLKK